MKNYRGYPRYQKKKQLGWYHGFSFLGKHVVFLYFERDDKMDLKEKQPKIFIVCGKARHGKDTVAEMIRNFYLDKKYDVLNLQYSSYIKEYAKKISNWDGSEETKPRELLQQLGTNIIRDKIDEAFFVKKLVDDIKVYSFFFDVLTISDARFKLEVDTPRKNFDDVIVIRVNRPNFDNGLTEEQKMHRTEIDLDDYEKYDYVITNDGDLQELKEKVKKIVEQEME